MIEQTFTLFWRTGDRELVRGVDIADAIRKRGYGAGAMSVLDFWKNGDAGGYEFDRTNQRWSSLPSDVARPAE